MKSYEKIKNMLVSAVAVVAMLANTVVIAEENEKDFVHTLKIDGDYLVISGESDFANNDINVFLLNEGKTVADLNEANSTGKIKAVANYCNVLSSDMNGNFSDRLNISDLDDEGRYLLYVKSSGESYTKYIEKLKRFYVSPSGSDSAGDGSKSNPFKTINYARDYIRNIEKTVPIEVVMEEGVYNVSNTITFGSQDSGTKDAPITYKAAENAKVVFEGTTNIDVTKVTGVTDADIISRLQEGMADKIVQIDLKEQGIPEKIVNFLASHSAGISGKPMGVYLNDEPQNISRWPNAGYKEILSGSTEGGSASDGTASKGGAVVKISGLDKERASRWVNQDNMYVEGYLGNDWHGEWAKVKSVNSDDLTVTLDTHTHYGVAVGKRIAAINLPEEIDVPGEWYVDAETMKMYYYPPHTLTVKDELEIATLGKNFVRVNASEYLNFDGIEFAKNANTTDYATSSPQGSNGITLSSEASNIGIRNCTFRDIGMEGIVIYASDVDVEGCTIYNTGYNGISITSGDRNTLESGNVKISDCIITKVTRDTGENRFAGIRIDGVGTVVENNIIFDIPNSAIRYTGNNHIIRYNEIYNCVNNTSDAGAIYAGRNWTNYGTKIMNNYFHDIGAGIDSSYAASAVFWDDYHSGNAFIGNIVSMNNMVKTSGVKIGGGRDNIVDANIFVNSLEGVTGEDRSSNVNPSIWYDPNDSGLFYNKKPFQTFTEAAVGVENAYNIKESDWNEVYVNSFPKIMENFNHLRYYRKYTRVETITNNAIYNCSTGLGIASKMKADSTISNNVTLSQNDFVDAKNGDYRVKSSVKASYGLSNNVLDENFDMNLIGLQNEYFLNSENMNFDLMYPANNESISNTATSLKWNDAPFADYYTYEVAKDSEFKNIVSSGTTNYNVVEISGLEEEKAYFWRVTAVNNSREIGCSALCSEVFRFTTSGELLFEEIEYKNSENVIKYSVKNTQKIDDAFTVVVAVKNADGKLIAVRSADEVIVTGAKKEFSINTAFETDLKDLDLEFYAWSSLETMKNHTHKKIFKK